MHGTRCKMRTRLLGGFVASALARLRRRAAPSLELAVERAAIEPEHARGRRLVATQRVEHGADVAPLDLFHGKKIAAAGEADGQARVAEPGDPLRKVFDPDVIELRERDRPLHAVLQLTNVPRPRIDLELLGG